MQNNEDLKLIKSLANSCFRNWKWFVVSVATMLFFAGAYLFIKQPIYLTSASILVKEDEMSGKMSALQGFDFGIAGSMEVADEKLVISSYSKIRKVVSELQLYTNYSETKYFVKKKEIYNERVINLEIPESIIDTMTIGMKYNIAINSEGLVNIKGENLNGKNIFEANELRLPAQVSTSMGTFALTATSKYEPGKTYCYSIEVVPLDIATESYSRLLSVYLADRKANVISLNIEGTCVDKYKCFLNSLISIYNRDALVDKNLVYENTAEFIDKRLMILNSQLSDAETEIEIYKQNKGLFNMNEESSALLELNNQLEPRYIEVQSQLMFVEDVLNNLKSDKGYNLIPSGLGLTDINATKSIETYNEAVLERNKLLKTTTSVNPSLVLLEQRLSSIKENVIFTMGNLYSSLRMLSQQLAKRQDMFRSKLENAPTIEKEFLEIKRNQVIKEKLVLFLMEKSEENSLSLAVTAPKAQILDAAFTFVKPVSTSKKLILLVAFAIGLIIPIVVIYLKDLFKETFENRDELESLLGGRILGEICKSNKADVVVVGKNEHTPISELFRSVRNNLAFIMKKDEKVIMVTSTTSKEGKSFVSINMALSLSLTGKNVVLVGLDLRNPMIAKDMNIIHQSVGVSNYLSNSDLDVRDIICYNYENTGLDVIVAGPIPPNPGELLLDSRLDLLISELKSKYDYVVIDSAPVGVISDSYSITRTVDMTLYITRANFTKKSCVKVINSAIEEKMLNKVYVLLNDTELSSSAYGYGYGYGTSEEKRKS